MTEIKKGTNRFYVGESEENPLAEITYKPSGDDVISIDRTYVSNELRGQGMAKRLLEEAINYARSENKKIIPLCSFVKEQMENNKEYNDLLQ